MTTLGGLVCALLVMSLTGCETLAGRHVDDWVITDEVKTKLATDQTGSMVTKLNVDTNLGTVLLNGNVKSAAAKQQVAELVGQVEGVTAVINHLQVQAEG